MTSSAIPALTTKPVSRHEHLLDVLAQVPDPRKRRGRRNPAAVLIAIDGTSVRGARTREQSGPHLVAALLHGAGAVIGQLQVPGKSNEIPAVRELLGTLELAGTVVTMDALHTPGPDSGPGHRRRGRLRGLCEGQPEEPAPQAQSAALGPGTRPHPHSDRPWPPVHPHDQGRRCSRMDRVRRR